MDDKLFFSFFLSSFHFIFFLLLFLEEKKERERDLNLREGTYRFPGRVGGVDPFILTAVIVVRLPQRALHILLFRALYIITQTNKRKI